MRCKICEGSAEAWTTKVVRAKHKAQYYRCQACGFVFVQDPVWIDQKSEEAINDFDIGLAHRNVAMVNRASRIIQFLVPPKGTFLDYAGGYGLFVRLMRDRGFNFYWHDDFCKNIFSGPFAAPLDNLTKYTLVTAFELLEHLTDPLSTISKILSATDHLLFSTELIPRNSDDTSDYLDHWPYWGLEHGQHISFFTKKALEVAAKKNSSYLVSDGCGLHLISKHKISDWKFKLLARQRLGKLFDPFLSKESLLQKDVDDIRQRYLNKQDRI